MLTYRKSKKLLEMSKKLLRTNTFFLRTRIYFLLCTYKNGECCFRLNFKRSKEKIFWMVFTVYNNLYLNPAVWIRWCQQRIIFENLNEKCIFCPLETSTNRKFSEVFFFRTISYLSSFTSLIQYSYLYFSRISNPWKRYWNEVFWGKQNICFWIGCEN